MDELVREFLAEGTEQLDRLDRELAALGRDPGSPQLLAAALRTLHTIKGTSGCLGLHRLAELTHAGEGLLAGLCERELLLTPPVARQLDELVGAMRLLFAQLAAGLPATAFAPSGRLQPIDSVWSRLPWLARTLADRCGKQVRLQLAGGEIELDRDVLAAIRDPLTHLVRNAVDHGIEPAGRRLAVGKPAHGTVRLAARTTAGRVVVEVADDGAGIDLSGWPTARWPAAWSAPSSWPACRSTNCAGWCSGRACPPRRRSAWCPAAESAWTWSGPIWKASAAASRSTPSPAAAPAAGSGCRNCRRPRR
jgi:chemotaxis protein histidine kinase CheA